MTDSVIIEVIIGMALLYMLLALICTSANELIATAIKLRSKTLKQGIARLLNDENSEGLINLLYNHPLINNLGSKKRGPSYIPAASFSVALRDSLSKITPADTSELDKAISLAQSDVVALRQKLAKKSSDATKSKFELARAKLADLEEIKATVEECQCQTANLVANDDKTRQASELMLLDAKKRIEILNERSAPNLELVKENYNLKSLSENIPDPQLRILFHSLNAYEENFDQNSLNGLETWFNAGMDRVSGWYKRKTQIITLIVAALLTTSMNVDSLAVGRALWKEPALRTVIADSATELVAGNIKENAELQSSPLNQIPFQPKQIRDQISVFDTSTNDPSIDEITTLVDELQFPTGWKQFEERLKQTPKSDRFVFGMQTFLGWLITILAISLGAPFWFDVLSKFVRMRGAGDRPEDFKTNRSNA